MQLVWCVRSRKPGFLLPYKRVRPVPNKCRLVVVKGQSRISFFTILAFVCRVRN